MIKQNDIPRHKIFLRSAREKWKKFGRIVALLPALALFLAWLAATVTSSPVDYFSFLTPETKWVIAVGSLLAGGLLDLLKENLSEIEYLKKLLEHLKASSSDMKSASRDIHKILRQLQEQSDHRMAVRDQKRAQIELAHRLASVEKGIKVIDTTPGNRGLRSDAYLANRDDLLKRDLSHQRIALIRTEVDLEAVLHQAEATQSPNFFIGCFLETSPEAPLFSLLIIDDCEVHLGAGWLGTPGIDSFDIEMQSKEAAGSFNSYFDILFSKSRQLRDREGFHADVARQVREEFHSRSHLQVFSTGYPEELTVSIRSARELDIVSYPHLVHPNQRRRQYFDTLREAIVSGGLRHRRIIWNKDQARFIQSWLEDEDLRKSENFEVRFANPASMGKPIFYFDLIDNMTAIIAQDLVSEQWAQVREHTFVRMLKKYFDELWHDSKSSWIKDNDHGGKVNHGILESVERSHLGRNYV